MNMSIMILTCTKCCPKGKDPYTRLDYICTDTKKMVSSEKCKGRIVAPMFISGTKAFDSIPESIIGTEVIAVLETKDNPRNPMKPYVQTNMLKTKNGDISLL